MNVAFKEQQEACGFNVAGIEAMKRAVLASPVMLLGERQGKVHFVTLAEAIEEDKKILEACKREKLYRPCGDLCGTRPCPPGSSYLCCESKDTFSCDCMPKGRCICKYEAFDEFERVHGDTYYDYTKCDDRGIPAPRGFYLPPYSHLNPADFGNDLLAW